jgi:hypothetical protein
MENLCDIASCTALSAPDIWLGVPDQWQKCLVGEVQMRGKKHKSEVVIEAVIWRWIEISHTASLGL